MGKKSVGILIGVAAVAAVLGGTGYYFRDDIRQMIPIFDDGSSEDKVYVEKVSRIMNQYAGVSNRYNGVVETQDSYEKFSLDTVILTGKICRYYFRSGTDFPTHHS